MNAQMKSAAIKALTAGLLCAWLGLGGPIRGTHGQSAPAAGEATPPPPTLEDQTFVFSPRGRRDPFEPPFARAGSDRKTGKEIVGTRDTINRAAKLLEELNQAAKAKNAAHFKAIYDNLTQILNTKFTSEELRIWSLEMSRTARKLKDEMGSYEQNMAAETVLQDAEKRILDLQTQIQQGRFEQVKEIYQSVMHDLTGLNLTEEALKQRRDEMLARAGRLVSQADAAIARDLLARGESLLAGMKDKLQKEKFEEVLAEFQNLQNRLGALSLTDDQLKQSRDKLLGEAEQVAHQAEIGAVMREMKKAESILARMSTALDASDFAAVATGYQNIQEIVKPLKVTDPSLIERKAEMLEKGAALDRSAKIRTEFLTRDVKINGIAWSPTNSAAIINGRSYGEGDAMDDVTRIEKIGKSDVIFKYKGESVTKPQQ